jgi:dTDP-4-amino-4,6-dideoxygalactose transaminase
LFRDENTKDIVKKKLYEKGITALTHFVPLHDSTMGRSLGYRQGDLRKTELAGKCLLRLPLYTDMSEVDMNYIGEKLIDILEGL